MNPALRVTNPWNRRESASHALHQTKSSNLSHMELASQTPARRQVVYVSLVMLDTSNLWWARAFACHVSQVPGSFKLRFSDTNNWLNWKNTNVSFRFYLVCQIGISFELCWGSSLLNLSSMIFWLFTCLGSVDLVPAQRIYAFISSMLYDPRVSAGILKWKLKRGIEGCFLLSPVGGIWTYAAHVL